MFGCQQLEGIEQLRVIERLVIARDQANIFAILESQGPVAVEFDFVEPIALGELLDRERFHRFNKRKAHLGAYFSSTITEHHYTRRRVQRILRPDIRTILKSGYQTG